MMVFRIALLMQRYGFDADRATMLAEGTRSASLALPMAPLAFLGAASCAVSAVVMALRTPE